MEGRPRLQRTTSQSRQRPTQPEHLELVCHSAQIVLDPFQTPLSEDGPQSQTPPPPAAPATPGTKRSIASASRRPRKSFPAPGRRGPEGGGFPSEGSPEPNSNAGGLLPEQMSLVDDLAGIERMRSVILGGGCGPEGTAGEGSGGGDGEGVGGGGLMAVGMDTEWQPYGRDEPMSPVSILQV